MYVNGNVIGSTSHDSSHSLAGQSSPFTLQSTLNLQQGEQVWVQIGCTGWSTSIELTDRYYEHYTHFMGWLIEEDISKSL